MKTRIITGVVAAFLLVWLLNSGPVSLIVSVTLVAAALAYLEFDRIFFSDESRSPKTILTRQIKLITLISLTMLSMPKGATASWVAFWLSFILLASLGVVTAEKDQDMPNAVRRISLELAGYIYVLGLLGFVVPILEVSAQGRNFLFFLFVVVFTGDSIAYFVGMKFGRHRLAPHLSPKKSWEGALGSLVGALIAAAAWLHFSFGVELTSEVAIKFLLVTPVLNVLAQLGDLFESLLKRSQTVKDSGALFPGHGGILDRIDAFLLSSPVFYFFLIYVVEV